MVGPSLDCYFIVVCEHEERTHYARRYVVATSIVWITAGEEFIRAPSSHGLGFVI